MKLGVFMVLFGGRSLEEALDYVASQGLDAVEIGTGGNPGDKHCKPDELLENDTALKNFKKAVESRGLTISALSCHGNPLHPQKHLAQADHDAFLKTVRLAEKLEVPVVNTFSGCPGDHEDAKYPNWPVAPWPNDFQEVLKWQWENKIIPYWTETGKFAADHHVKIGLELHGASPCIHQQPYFVCVKRQERSLVLIWTRAICGGRELIPYRRFKFWAEREPSTISMPRIRRLIRSMLINTDLLICRSIRIC